MNAWYIATLLFAIVMVFAIILSRQAVQGRSDGKHGEHHRDGWRGQGEVPRPPPAAEPGVRPGRQDDLPSLATNLTDEAAKLVADPKSTLDHMKERQSTFADLQLEDEYGLADTSIMVDMRKVIDLVNAELLLCNLMYFIYF